VGISVQNEFNNIHTNNLLKTCGFIEHKVEHSAKLNVSDRVELTGGNSRYVYEHNHGQELFFGNFSQGVCAISHAPEAETDGNRHIVEGDSLFDALPTSNVCQYVIEDDGVFMVDQIYGLLSDLQLDENSNMAIFAGQSYEGRPLFMCGGDWVDENGPKKSGGECRASEEIEVRTTEARSERQKRGANDDEYYICLVTERPTRSEASLCTC